MDVKSALYQGATRTEAHNPKRTAIILAGGRSSRFGSNKALHLLAGVALIRHTVERLRGVVDEVVVVIGRGESRHQYAAALPRRVIVKNDDLRGRTPLVGISAGLRATESDHVAVLACDTPFVNARVIEFLFGRALKAGADAAIPRWNSGSIEPLEAAYRRLPTLQVAKETLARPGLSLKDMIDRLGRIVFVSIEDEIRKIDGDLRTFFNINTRKDLATAKKMLAEKPALRTD